jgi:hypothetical protein
MGRCHRKSKAASRTLVRQPARDHITRLAAIRRINRSRDQTKVRIPAVAVGDLRLLVVDGSHCRCGPRMTVPLSNLRTDTSDFEINFYSLSLSKHLARVSLPVPNVLATFLALRRITIKPNTFRPYSKFE